MSELSKDLVCLVIMEDSRINESYFNIVDSQIVSEQDIKAIIHDSVACLGHHVTRVFQVTFK